MNIKLPKILKKPYIFFVVGVFFFGFSMLFVVFGTLLNPNVQNLFSNTESQSVRLQTWFDIPSSLINGSTLRGLMESNAIATDFSVGKDIGLNLMLNIWNFRYKIDMVTIEPSNCLISIPLTDSNQSTMSVTSRISMFQISNSTWFGSQTIEPQTAGNLKMRIRIDYFSSYNSTELKNFTTDMTISQPNIKSGFENIEQRNQNQNESYTLFALFFAGFAVALWFFSQYLKDQSKRKRKLDENNFVFSDYEGYG